MAEIDLPFVVAEAAGQDERRVAVEAVNTDRAALRAALVKALWQDGLMHTMGPEDLADVVLGMGEVDDVWEVHKDDDAWAGGGWVAGGYRDRAEAMASARKNDAQVRCRFTLCIDVPFEVEAPGGE